ncbi:hypothetical protein [Azotobacter chroococcum]|uniref:Nucleotide-diphospho-sugar transferase n=1 Tax=Azotobacter chroococcum TaxID=353 RepID=A0AAP9YDX1_9GAMM|nr:hypothetical protein [Azotobacter chroococcum]QQE89510.1 hypothetical protein GKQ51_03925 [Azotobacter chroococcum]
MSAATERLIDIVIRSYYRDLAWLALALRALKQFVSGYRRVVVVVPRSSLDRFDSIIQRNDPQVSFLSCEDFTDDYLGQQITKLHADLYTDANVIVHLDSDQIFVAQCNLYERLLVSGKLRMNVQRSSDRAPSDGWRHCPSIFFGEPIAWDLTAPPPLAVPRQLYGALRAYCKDRHNKSLTDYAMGFSADRFCEMALLRGFALLYEASAFIWVDGGQSALIPECRSFWSRDTTPAKIAKALPTCLLDTL